MNRRIYFILILAAFSFTLKGQKLVNDSVKTVKLDEVVITANRMPVIFRNNPGSITLVTPDLLALMPKGTAAEEALRLVPGVRIDNQHDGERVHVSIRGQGILTERGLRGIGVIIDGIPVNDPSGFAPDLYDVDWGIVKKIEVLRGPAASLYGGGGAAGIVNIITRNGGPVPLEGEFSQSVGSNGFLKSSIRFGGSNGTSDYQVSYSRTKGDGYRDHQAFWGNKFNEKINFYPVKNLKITQIFTHTDYFQQNPEGLNLQQFDNLLQANPDARPFNEYQKTNRSTFGLAGTYQIAQNQDVQVSSFYRSWNYKETSNKCAEYRTYTVPGASAQYNLHLGKGSVKNHLSAGLEFKGQKINMYKLQSAGNPNRAESIDETNIETDSLLANQIISQQNLAFYGLYKLEYGKFTLLGSLRYDEMDNKLINKMVSADTAEASKNYPKTSARIGASYSVNNFLTLFANWSQGVMPPSTEELASNPVGYSGFNTHLVPATSGSFELGLRGSYKDILFYDLTAFTMNTKNDFFRFKQTGRGNQEVFYGNAGNSKRNGFEAFISLKLFKKLSLEASYTFADYKYTSATIDPVYTDTAYVLTTPPASGQWLPNSPRHQLYAEIVYSVNNRLKVSLGTEFQSKWAVYTDASAYRGEGDPAIYQNWQDGFNLYHARISYQWNLWKLKGECSLYARNFTDKKYMAFTEPDPDGNSYQPGPGKELFGNIKIEF